MHKLFKRRITEAYFNFVRSQDSTIAITKELVHRMANNYTEVDEFFRFADEALAQTIAEFDTNGGGSFTTLLYTKIKNALRHARDVEVRVNRVGLVNNEILASFQDNRENFEIAVRDCLDCLNPQSHRIITKIFFEGKSLREIAIEENTNYMAIFIIKQNALEQMRTTCSV